MTTIIRLDDVEKVYGRAGAAVHALRGVSLTVERGELVAIVGASGSGKTTLLDVIGLLTSPTSGSVVIEGFPVDERGDRRRTRFRNSTFGYLRQDFALVDEDSAFRNVEIPLIYSRPRPSRRDRRKRVLSVLERVDMETRERRRVATLSGGERQRVAIARALANDTKIILADEPTGSIDSKAADRFFEVLLALSDTGVTVLIATHNLAIAEQCPRIIELQDGAITSA